MPNHEKDITEYSVEVIDSVITNILTFVNNDVTSFFIFPIEIYNNVSLCYS